MNRPSLRAAAQAIFEHALRSVDARVATERAIQLQGSKLIIHQSHFDVSSRAIYVVAIGKAAPAMAAGLSGKLGSALTAGIVTGPKMESTLLDPKRWRSFVGGHPLPNEQSLAAAQAVFELLSRANHERAIVIFLISGGGSAMIESPRSTEITLPDLQETNRLLVACGASIAEVNSVRAEISEVKAGGLAGRASLCQQVSLIISDTNDGDEMSVASGPTFQATYSRDTYSRDQAREVIARYHLAKSLPRSVSELLDSPPPAWSETNSVSDSSTPAAGLQKQVHYVLLDNKTALKAAAEKARELGFITEIASDICEQGVADGCRLLVERAATLFEHSGEQPACLISGGEFSCPVVGNGIGGRNSETVLRCLLELAGSDVARLPRFTIISAGTDGIDGNSQAAGAIADSETLARALSMGMSPRLHLDSSDTFTFFDRLGDALITGVTGTNVRDIRIVLASAHPSVVRQCR